MSGHARQGKKLGLPSICLAVFLLGFFPFNASAADISAVTQKGAVAVTDAELEALFRISGFDTMIGTLPSRINALVTQVRPDMRDEERLQLAQRLNDGTIPARVFRSGRDIMRNTLDTTDVQAIKSWMSGDVGARFVKIERGMWSAEQQKKMQEFVAKAASRALDFDRTQLLRELDTVTSASASQRAIVDDMEQMLNEQLNMSPEIMQKTSQSTARAKADIEEKMLWSMAFVYEKMSDSDLKAAIAFYRTPLGQKWAAVARGISRESWRVINQAVIDYRPQAVAPR